MGPVCLCFWAEKPSWKTFSMIKRPSRSFTSGMRILLPPPMSTQGMSSTPRWMAVGASSSMAMWWSSRGSGGLQPQRQGLEGVVEVGADPLRLARALDARGGGEQLVEEHLALQPGEVHAEAEVLGEPERQVRVGRAVDVEAVRVGEDGFVAVGRRVH